MNTKFGNLTHRILSAFIVLALTGIGCTAKYKTKIAQQEDEIAKLQIENNELKSSIADLEAAKAELETAKAELDQRIASMTEYQQALEKKLEELGVDKTKIAEKYASAQKDLASLKKQQAKAKRRLKILKNMLSKFKSLIDAGKLKVRIRRGKMMLELPSKVLFPLGEDALSEDGKKTLAEIAKVLARIQGREFQVVGHTDSVPVTSGKFPSNWELSTARAVSVVKYLQQKGVRPGALSAAGYSQYQPAVSNKDPERRALNRRIEITIMPDLDELPNLSYLKKELKK